MTMTGLLKAKGVKVVKMNILCGIALIEDEEGEWYYIYKYLEHREELVCVRAYSERESADAAYIALAER